MNPHDGPTRRDVLGSGAAWMAGGAVLLTAGAAAGAAPATRPAPAPAEPGDDFVPVVTPNGVTLPHRVVDGVKVYHLVAEEIEHEFAPGLRCKCWGYNGRTPGPTIEAVEGDRVRFYVTNRLPAPTTVHWHGVRVPNGMDGVNGVTQRAIEPGETFKYEFTLVEHGTFMYHPHFDEMTQQALGMMGMFVIHPRNPEGPRVDRDFCLMLSEWRVDVGASRPNPTEMTDFNVLTFNSKAYPGTEPMVVRKGQRVRIRFGNLGAMDHHPIHLHGYQARVTETDAGRIPESAQVPVNTVLVPVGSTRAIELVADVPGDWVMHCHMTHHVMNQMGHGVPNLVGVKVSPELEGRITSLLPGYMTMGENGMGEMAEHQTHGHMPAPANSIPMVGATGPFGIIDMGGMFTILKVREGIAGYEEPGWYAHPRGTVAEAATGEELKRDGIEVR